MRIPAALAVLLLFSQGTALAECTRPRPDFQIPEGSGASEQELTALQGKLIGFAEQVREYLRCLNGEVGQRSIGKDEATRTKIAQEHLQAHHEAASELKGLADCYAAQLEAFKESGGGKEHRAADCAPFIEAASNSADPRAPLTRKLVVEASGYTYEVDGGSWIFYLVRDDQPRPCSPRDTSADCLYRAVHVRNDSDAVLECTGEITYEGTDSNGNATTRSQMLVAERATYVVVQSLAKQGINAETFDAQCKARPPLPPLDTPADCKYEVVQPIAIADYYPEEAREAGHEGPVIVEFTLSGKAARPTNVRAVSGSMHESLDQAAVKAVSEMVMRSSCGKAKFRLKVNFQLER
jgi:TonB family protein